MFENESFYSSFQNLIRVELFKLFQISYTSPALYTLTWEQSQQEPINVLNGQTQEYYYIFHIYCKIITICSDSPNSSAPTYIQYKGRSVSNKLNYPNSIYYGVNNILGKIAIK